MIQPPTHVQHKATLSINGRNVDIHAPPFMPAPQLEEWLAEALKAQGCTLVTKSWATADPNNVDSVNGSERVRGRTAE